MNLLSAGAGELYLGLAFLGSFFGMLMAAVAARRGQAAAHRLVSYSSAAVVLFMAAAAGVLLRALLVGDYRFQAVYEYSDRFLSWPYRAAAFYAGQKGSLLLWGLILALFTFIFSRRRQEAEAAVRAWALALCFLVLTFFLYLSLFVERAFALLPFTPADGRGLNPILQNPAMWLHPPILYLGYIAYTVPFAYALGELLAGGEMRFEKAMRRWALAAWVLLGAGNLLGAWWAYAELGWGGYWGWDPVENASLMPWLLGTALLHSMLARREAGHFVASNRLLVAGTFLLTITGTLITRSGLIESVHSFGRSSLGYYFLGFLLGLTALSAALLVKHWKQFERRPLIRWFSREGGFFGFNLLAAVMVGLILLGVFLPSLSPPLLGRKIGVTAAYYNQALAPLGCLLLLLLGFGVHTPWRGNFGEKGKMRHFARPLWAAGLAAILLWLNGVRTGYALVSLALVVFAVSILWLALWREWQGFRCQEECGWGAAARQLRRRAGQYGAMLVHLGVLLMFVGFAGNLFQKEKEVSLSRGQETNFASYRVRLENLNLVSRPEKTAVGATLEVSAPGRRGFVVQPRKEFWVKHEQPVSEVAIRTSLTHDLYFILGNFEVKEQRASLKLVQNPLVTFVWLGGLLLVLGTAVSFFRRLTENGEKP